ncbi:MAG: hypothetical protein OXC80_15220 [Gammaproteobacteria bacterium]|nr:hypothetical protein [Gammaproteobacteria bacterium]
MIERKTRSLILGMGTFVVATFGASALASLSDEADELLDLNSPNNNVLALTDAHEGDGGEGECGEGDHDEGKGEGECGEGECGEGECGEEDGEEDTEEVEEEL